MSENNSVKLTGRLTRDPEVAYTKNGKVFAKFAIAVDLMSHGEKSVMFVPMVAFGDIAEDIGNNCHKGTKLICEEGTLRIEKSKDGTKTYTSVTVWKAQYIQPKTGKLTEATDGSEEEIPF